MREWDYKVEEVFSGASEPPGQTATWSSRHSLAGSLSAIKGFAATSCHC